MEGKYCNILNYNCYARPNIICDSISIKCNGICDQCNNIINEQLTEKDLLNNYLSVKQNIINYIKKKLIECENVIGKEKKIRVVFDVYEKLYNNIYFMFSNIKFFKTIINKIKEFIIHNNSELILFVNNYKDYNFIYEFMKNIYDFTLDLNLDILDNYDENNNEQKKFLLEFINFLNKIYCINKEFVLPNTNYEQYILSNINDEEIVINI
jgi:hypothetical protein